MKRRLGPLFPARPKPLVLAGVLLALAHPPFNLLVPSFVALVPFTVWLAGLPSGSAGAREARRGGFLLGLIYFTLVFYWLLIALVYYTAWAVGAFLAPVLILSGFLAVAVWGMHAVRVRLGWPVWVALPVFWTALEWFRANLPEVGFPWMGLGDTLTAYPWLIDAADLVGARGLSFWLCLMNALIATWILAKRDRRGPGVHVRPREFLIGTLLAALVPLGYSLARWSSLDLRPAARVAVIQPNIPEDIKLNRDLAIDSARTSTLNLSRRWLEEGERFDLVLLPETVFPRIHEPLPETGYPGRPDIVEWAARLAANLDAPVLYGGIGLEDTPGPGYSYFNSAFLVHPDGRLARRYDKRFLVPIVERVPFFDPERFSGLDYFGAFGVGEWAEPFEVPVGTTGAGRTSRFGVMVCYESIFAPLSRHYRRAGADFLVNVTNDAWFGREAWWSRSSALWQHPAHLVMRAIETRMGVARSANTGFSQLVDPLGRVSRRTELFEPAEFTGVVLTTDARTLYVLVGDLVGWASALSALVACLLIWVRSRQEKRRSSESE